MWMEEDPEHRINLNRVREALGKKPDAIAVACPYCMTMFEDGVKDLGADRSVKVLDVAELVAARLARPKSSAGPEGDPTTSVLPPPLDAGGPSDPAT